MTGTTTAIIVAAGAGERLGRGAAKALVPLAGVPMVVHAVRAFTAAASIDAVVVVLPPGEHGDLDLGDVITTQGGETRQQSVANGLDACPAGTWVVAVHDAARPLVTPALIDRTVAALHPPWDAVAPGLPVVDTLKVVDTRQAVLRTADRSSLWAVQTPQVATRATLERVHARIASDAQAATDDLSLIERAGGRVRLVEGDRRNFKITHAEDLELAEHLLGGEPARLETAQ
jgi:2-C-methyl-D-erythritol 4-phosphate cytidylyltransferase